MKCLLEVKKKRKTTYCCGEIRSEWKREREPILEEWGNWVNENLETEPPLLISRVSPFFPNSRSTNNCRWICWVPLLHQQLSRQQWQQWHEGSSSSLMGSPRNEWCSDARLCSQDCIWSSALVSYGLDTSILFWCASKCVCRCKGNAIADWRWNADCPQRHFFFNKNLFVLECRLFAMDAYASCCWQGYHGWWCAEVWWTWLGMDEFRVFITWWIHSFRSISRLLCRFFWRQASCCGWKRFLGHSP